jgi:hypothetical protein
MVNVFKNVKTKKVYKIRHKKTGMFHNGKEFTPKGKTWAGLGFVKTSLNYSATRPIRNPAYREYRYQRVLREDVENWELVEYELTEISRQDIKPMMEEKLKKQ